MKTRQTLRRRVYNTLWKSNHEHGPDIRRMTTAVMCEINNARKKTTLKFRPAQRSFAAVPPEGKKARRRAADSAAGAAATMTHALHTVRELMSALVGAPLDAGVYVPDSSGSLCVIRAELNTVPPLIDSTGMSKLLPVSTVRVILLPLDRLAVGWPGGETRVLRPSIQA